MPAGQRAPAEAPRTDTHAAPAQPSSRNADGKGSKLIVGPDIKLKGVEITDCDTLVVEGRVEASMDSRVIQIAEEGVFQGTAGIDVAEINGRFEGELTARKQLVIRATGKVTGKIRYGKLMIEEGGELSGDIGTLTAGDSLARKEQQNRQPVPKALAGMV
jgi:cytoskeletal protein CcmA (bactofilin family)